MILPKGTGLAGFSLVVCGAILLCKGIPALGGTSLGVGLFMVSVVALAWRDGEK